MIFVPREDQAPYFRAFQDEHVRRFLDDHYDFRFLKGILFLPRALSAVVSVDGPDDSIDDGLIFGIPADYRRGTRWTVLPGAPMAYIKWNYYARDSDTAELRDAVQGYDDIRILRESVRRESVMEGEHFEISPSVLEKIDNYYCETEAGQKVRSFQSFPLVNDDGTRTAFGVLNVHCDQPMFLGEQSSMRKEIFASVMAPLVFDIATVVNRWREVAQDILGGS